MDVYIYSYICVVHRSVASGVRMAAAFSWLAGSVAAPVAACGLFNCLGVAVGVLIGQVSMGCDMGVLLREPPWGSQKTALVWLGCLC